MQDPTSSSRSIGAASAAAGASTRASTGTPDFGRGAGARANGAWGLADSDAVYVFCAVLFSVVLVLTNIVGVKLFYLFPNGGPDWIQGGKPLLLTSGIITYPITFLLTDVVSEIWGRKRANGMVVLGFVMSLVMLGIVHVALWLPPGSEWSGPAGSGFGDGAAMQRAFSATFAYPAVLLGSSMTAYLVAQLFDVRLYHFWRRVTHGKHLWLRNNGSTAISQLVDTIIVNGIFLGFGLKLEWELVGQIIVAVYCCKLVLAVIDTPLIYLAVGYLRKRFGLEPGALEEAPLA